MRGRMLKLAGVVLVVALLAMAGALLAALPALVLFAALAARWFPGERTVQRWRAALRRHRKRTAVAVVRVPRRAIRALRAAGTPLLALHLASRPPPAGACAR
ncbi:hypothetical protein [Conexibacter sp. SYSU D00693]|uniref:hypothetical protein n=1 Tax=Conexibacter sp. SYSU D00693 TaxID=2812560 RepID=UPI00196B464B|nr:hypothetical protein [Conexibacter sp. SYSU D00693]